MKTINVTNARANLYKLLEETSKSHEPVQITGKKTNGVLLSEEDWKSIQETLFLTSISGMRESIIEGMHTSVDECLEEIEL